MHGQMVHVGRCGELGCHSNFRFVTVVPLVPMVGDGTFGHVDEKVVLRVESPSRVVRAGGSGDDHTLSMNCNRRDIDHLVRALQLRNHSFLHCLTNSCRLHTNWHVDDHPKNCAVEYQSNCTVCTVSPVSVKQLKKLTHTVDERNLRYLPLFEKQLVAA